LKDFQSIKVIHCMESWLPRTAVWLYNEIKNLPPNIENYIVCLGKHNIDQYPIKNIRSWSELPEYRKWGKRLLRKVGLVNPLKMHIGILSSEIERVKPGILHSHFGHFGWANLEMAKKKGLAHVTQFYGADVNFLPKSDQRWLDRYGMLSNYVDLVLCEGPFMAKSIANLGIAENKIKIHRLGIDLEQVAFLPRKYEKGKTLRFLIAGSFREKKGIPYAIEALGMYSSINDKIAITIIGDAGHLLREKKEKERILEMLKKYKLENKVRFMGFQPYKVLLEEAYCHDVFISPSVTAVDGDSEGGAPVTIIEMAASGMPIISTTHCDIPYVLSRENGKYLVAERDSKALCDAICSLMDDDWEKIIFNNRKLVEHELDAKKQGKSLYEIYVKLINCSGGCSIL
jgi:colanic acid/amylovoran biosynthesis glycosyltransferase